MLGLKKKKIPFIIKPSFLHWRSACPGAAAHLKCPPGCCGPEDCLHCAGALQNSQKPAILRKKKQKHFNRNR